MADPDYFTLAEFRLLPDMGSSTTYSDDQILAAAAYFTAIVEREIGEPFIPRTFTETLSGAGAYGLVLGQSHVRSIGSLTVGGTTVDTSLIDTFGGVLRYKANLYAGPVWTPGVANVVVTYVAGRYSAAPADIKDAVMWATRDRLLGQSDQNGVDIRRTSLATDMGTVSYVLPGEKRPTGYPELDALIASYVRTTPSFGFA